jgi:enoyl-CoA hydratase/carnithine racemase
MADDRMLAKKEDGVGWLTFNTPERRNAVSLEMWKLMGDILEDFDRDPAIRVVVLTGAGDKAFVSGADISKFEAERNTPEQVQHYEKVSARGHEALSKLSKPSIAMIRGFCVGGGVAIAVACDMRICEPGSEFAIPAARLGLGYGFPNLSKLVPLIGPQFAKEIFFTARRFSAEEAAAMGLVNRVVPKDELEAYVRNYARMIAENAPLTVTSVKRIINETLKDPDKRDLAECARLVKACFDSQDYVEGRTAFMEKRKPQFQGR